MKKLFLVLLISAIGLSGECHSLNPLDFGIREAKSGVERYEILKKCHTMAVEKGFDISYHGIDEIQIELPDAPESIPLPAYTDFQGVKLTVVNNSAKRFFLFKMSNEMSVIDVSAEDLDKGVFFSYKELKDKESLVVVEDLNIWSKRRGYDYHAMRKDVLIVKNGRSIHRPVYSYNTDATHMKVSYCKIDSGRKIVKNLRFNRPAGSKNKTFLLDISCQHNLEVSNISVTTPDDIIHDGDVGKRSF